MTDTAPDIVDHLVPFIAECRRYYDNDTLAEIHISRQLTEILFAVASELDCDTRTEEGTDAKRMISSAVGTVMQSLDAIERDVSRPRSVRRAELVAKLNKYQRELLGVEEETDRD